MQFPATRRELLDRLQMRAVVFGDRTEVKVLFLILPISNQRCSFTYEGDKGDGVGNIKIKKV